MLTHIQRLQIEEMLGMCKTEEGLRKMRELNSDEEFDCKFQDSMFNAWIRFCKERIEREGL